MYLINAYFTFVTDDLFKLTGTRIPYKNLGFSSLEACLNSSRQFTIQNRGGVSIVHAVASNKTQHLTELINKQKSKPPKKKPVRVNFIEIIINILLYPRIQRIYTLVYIS